MKTKNINSRMILLLCSIILFCCHYSSASHLFGGEITWKCLSNGQYQFQVKVYRDCNGIPMAPITQIGVYGHPTICTIPINPTLTLVNDLTPYGCAYNCSSGGPGAVEEFIFNSDTVALPGIPPASGWVFAVDDCCRNALINIGGGQGFTLRSVMYPYNATDASPCFDSSPYFAESPSVYAAIGYPFSYNPNAIDKERDSLVYSWANCIDEPTSATCSPFVAPSIGFQGAYSLTNQLPGNPTLNPITGEINFFVPTSAATTGNFATCIKVTAYRCGIKIAEIYRDCGFTLMSGGIVQSGGNLPPNIFPPFTDPGTGLQTAFADTVVAGDVVQFDFSATDLQSNIGAGLGQTITITASGDYFGTGFVNMLSGCGHPPCAILNPPPPLSGTDTVTTQFYWVTSCNLINNIQACTDNIYNTFYFVLAAKDDYCPASASTYSTISITVTGPEIQHSNDSIWIHYNGATAYQWYADGVLIPGATDSLYVIGIPGLFYNCQVATTGGCTLSSRLYFPTVGLKEFSSIRSFIVVPNPAKEKFSLHIGSADAKNTNVVFSDVTGRTLLLETLQLKIGNNTFEYSTEKFSSGIYFVKVGSGTGAVTRKIVIQ